MGDVSIIARRLEGGTCVQYGWSGNGGYFRSVGAKLIAWYQAPQNVEYLFSLGQLKLIGKPGSENGGEPWYYTHVLDDLPHWRGTTEREIFSQIAFIDYGYFYDLDNAWYYVKPGPFRIKVPLFYIGRHLDENGFEFDECRQISAKVAQYILGEYYASDEMLQLLVKERYPQGIESIKKKVLSSEAPCHAIWENFKSIFDYFDDWVVVETDDAYEKITNIVVRKNQKGSKRIETIDWK